MSNFKELDPIKSREKLKLFNSFTRSKVNYLATKSIL